MDRATICEKLRRFTVTSIYAHGSREWRAGRFNLTTDDGEENTIIDILDTTTHISFSTHYATRAIPRHAHPHFELMYLLRGRITHRLDGGNVTMGEGDLLMIAPGESHSVDACSDDTIAVNIILKPDFLSPALLRSLAPCGSIYEMLSGGRGGYLHLSARGSLEAEQAADMLLSEFLDPDVLSAELLKCHFISLMCAFYRAQVGGDGRVYTRRSDGHSNVTFVLSYIEKNYATATLNEAARQFGYDRSYLSKLIRRYTGRTFIELKHSFCVENAKLLLEETKLSVREISERIGFSNVSYFYEVFGSECGMTPSEWRQQHA